MAFMLFLAAIFSITWIKNSSFDFYFYLATVKSFFLNYQLPNHDPFIFSLPNYEWKVLHEWASMFSFSTVFTLAGELGAQILKLTLVGIIAKSLLLSYKRTKDLAYLFITIAFITIQFRLQLRGFLFGYFFFIISITYIYRLKNADFHLKHYLFFTLISCLWVNFHPSFILVFLSPLTLYSTLNDSKLFLTFTGAAFLGTLINPKGILAYSYPLQSFFDPGWELYKQFNQEWFALFNPHILNSYEPYLYITFVILGFVTLIQNKAQVGLWIIFLLTLFISIGAVRLIPYSILFCTFLFLSQKKFFFDRYNFEVLSPLIMLILTIKLIFFEHHNISGHVELGYGQRSNTFPNKAITILNGFPKEKLKIFNQHKFGSYLAYRWMGEPSVFFHGFVNDFNFYKNDYLSVNQSLGQFKRVNYKYNLNAYLLSNYPASKNSGPLLYQFLYRDPEWKMIYQDAQSILFVHTSLF
jgi:hypothetical protein